MYEAIANQFVETTCIALIVNDVETGYAYPTRVRFEISEKDINTYLSASDFHDINYVDLLCLQFEYGIIGGKAGNYILALFKGITYADSHNITYHSQKKQIMNKERYLRKLHDYQIE